MPSARRRASRQASRESRARAWLRWALGRHLRWPIVLAGLLGPGLVHPSQVQGQAPALADGAGGSQGEPKNALRMLLVRNAGDESVVARLRSELQAGAWSFDELPAGQAGPRVSLITLAQRRHASAAVRVLPERRQLELWIGDPAGDGTFVLEVLQAPQDLPPEVVLPLRAFEALRARNLPVGPAPGPQAAAPTPTVRRQPPARPARGSHGSHGAKDALAPSLWLSVAPAVSWSPGGLGPSFNSLVEARAALGGKLSLGASVLLPWVSAPARGPEGTATVSTLLLGAFADMRLARVPFVWTAGVEAAVALTRMQGDAADDFEADQVLVATPALALRSGVELIEWGPVRFGLAVHIGFTLHRVVARFADREAAHWGQPFALAAITGAVPLVGGDP